jgi:hypothetical protein
LSDEDEFFAAADRLLTALVRVVETAPPAVLEKADWDYADEDWVRDAVHDAYRYSTWRSTGEDHFLYRDPRVEPGRLKADSIAAALSHLLSGRWWQVPDDAHREAELALDGYRELRAAERDVFNRFR